MSIGIALLVFAGALALVSVSSVVMGDALEKIGARLNLSEALLGLLTALAADAPEISSAAVALLQGNHDLGTGVVIGSNLFNLAALMGLSAVVAGRVRIKKQAQIVSGTVALLTTALAVALVMKWISPAAALGLVLAVMAPYVLLSALRADQIRRLKLPGPVGRFLTSASTEIDVEAREDTQPPKAHWRDALTLVPTLVAVVMGSLWLVKAAVALAAHFALPHAVVGTLILASLTGVPNVLAALHLARAGRGSAVVSESLNSNALNVLAGLCLPALLIGLGPVNGRTELAAWWLLGLTAVVVALTYRGGGLRRAEGAVVIALYLAFVGVVLWRW